MINSADNLVHTPDGITSLYDVETNINAQLELTGFLHILHIYPIFHILDLFLHFIIFPSYLLEVLYLLEDLTFEVLQILIHRLEKMRHPSSEDPNSE